MKVLAGQPFFFFHIIFTRSWEHRANFSKPINRSTLPPIPRRSGYSQKYNPSGQTSWPLRKVIPLRTKRGYSHSQVNTCNALGNKQVVLLFFMNVLYMIMLVFFFIHFLIFKAKYEKKKLGLEWEQWKLGP